ncbi:MAG TPA: transcriptional regulator [Cytophagales bacterium]|nr:transcriptional regulator [Cytophagales bacterium]
MLFRVEYPEFGEITLRRFDPVADSAWLHHWVNQEYAYFWGMQGSTLVQVQEEYVRLLEPDHYQIYVGEFEGKPAFLLESYDPAQDLIARYYPVTAGDRGIHLIMAPASQPSVPHFTWYMFRAALDYTYQPGEVQRVLVEPDIRNKKMFALCERLGFVLGAVVELPHKTAQLAFHTPATYAEALRNPQSRKRSSMNTIDNAVSPQQAVTHLTSDRWHRANRMLVKKAITEFAHERLIAPKALDEPTHGWQTYRLEVTEDVYYTFQAKALMLNHLWIKEATLEKWEDSHSVRVDAVVFIKEFREALGMTDRQLPTYLEEIISTLQGSVYKMAKGNPTANELAQADFQTIEQSMTEGHPCFVANNGRIGFDSGDYRAYAPEAGNSFALLWLAGHKSKAVYSGLEDLPYEKTMAQELDEATRNRFAEVLKGQGLNPEDYLFLPIHPWQWFNKLSSVFAGEIAQQHLVCLGYGPDQYLAQQSIRTLFNSSHPEKFYTKSALSILNMGFMRGLPHYYLGTAPVMARWLEELLYTDAYLQANGFRMLSEVASVSYRNDYFEEFGPHNDFNKMLASLWRESPMSQVREGQTAMTMAALLHVDDAGDSLLTELIKASGLTPEAWLYRYFEAYLLPLLHCFYRYDLVFMPHGENLILVLEDHVPVFALLKDITEEACILSPDVELPEALKRMYAEVPEDVKLLSVFTDIFDDFFRFMVPLLMEHLALNEGVFWATLAEAIRAYQAQFPELAEKFAQYDLFAGEFTLSCLNRLQIQNNRQMIDLDDPVALLQFHGTLENPLAAYQTTEALLS